MIKRKNSSIVVSVDSGNCETFKKVKGVDWFERVWDNIGKYAEDGGHVIVKYILMGANKNQENIDGFIEMCKRNNIKHVRVSRDWNYAGGGIEEGVVATSVRLMKKARENGIVVHNDGTTAL